MRAKFAWLSTLTKCTRYLLVIRFWPGGGRNLARMHARATNVQQQSCSTRLHLILRPCVGAHLCQLLLIQSQAVADELGHVCIQALVAALQAGMGPQELSSNSRP